MNNNMSKTIDTIIAELSTTTDRLAQLRMALAFTTEDDMTPEQAEALMGAGEALRKMAESVEANCDRS